MNAVCLLDGVKLHWPNVPEGRRVRENKSASVQNAVTYHLPEQRLMRDDGEHHPHTGSFPVEHVKLRCTHYQQFRRKLEMVFHTAPPRENVKVSLSLFHTNIITG